VTRRRFPAVALADRRYELRSDADPRDVLGLGRRYRRQSPRRLRVIRAARSVSAVGWPTSRTLTTTACDQCGAIDVRGDGLVLVDRGDYLYGDEGRCGSCNLNAAPTRGWLEELGDGPRNVLVEDLDTAERFVRPFRGLTRTA
jgi:hypothetical protein